MNKVNVEITALEKIKPIYTAMGPYFAINRLWHKKSREPSVKSLVMLPYYFNAKKTGRNVVTHDMILMSLNESKFTTVPFNLFYTDKYGLMSIGEYAYFRYKIIFLANLVMIAKMKTNPGLRFRKPPVIKKSR